MSEVPASKRKNDDKTKVRPHRAAMIVGMMILIAGCVVTSFVIYARTTRTGPTGVLFYDTKSGTQEVNFASGERKQSQVLLSQGDLDRALTSDSKWGVSSDRLTGDAAIDATHELWLMNWETKEKEQLTDNAFAEMWPNFSPDNLKIVYVATPNGPQDIYVMDLTNRDVQSVILDMNAYWPIWSPDGQWIAFMTDHTGTNDMWIVRADGTEAQLVAVSTEAQSYPVWESYPVWGG